MESIAPTLDDFKRLKHGMTKAEVTAEVGQCAGGLEESGNGVFRIWMYKVGGRSLMIAFSPLHGENGKRDGSNGYDGIEQIFFGVGPGESAENVSVQHILEPVIPTKAQEDLPTPMTCNFRENKEAIRAIKQIQRGMSQAVLVNKMGRPDAAEGDLGPNCWRYGTYLVGFNQAQAGLMVDWIVDVGTDGTKRDWQFLPRAGCTKGELPRGILSNPKERALAQQQQQQHRHITTPTQPQLPGFMSIEESDVEPKGSLLKIDFAPNIKRVGNVKPDATAEELQGENTLIACSPEFAKTYGGAVTRELIKAIPELFFEQAERYKKHVLIDVHVHLLRQGDIPIYPGWHCVGWPRSTQYGQPDPTQILPMTHLMCTISTDKTSVAATEYLTSAFSTKIVYPMSQGFKLWQHVNAALAMATPAPQTMRIGDGHMMAFDQRTLLRCCPADASGWRLTFRASHSPKPARQQGGAIGRQEMVYIYSQSPGW